MLLGLSDLVSYVKSPIGEVDLNRRRVLSLREL